jgi:hypothetical protein
MQPQELAEKPSETAVEGGVAVKIVAIAVAAIGAAGEDDVDKHGNNPFPRSEDASTARRRRSATRCITGDLAGYQ